MKKIWDKIKIYLEISHVLPIGRRYFIMNSFDGAMTTLGIILGAYIAGIIDPLKIVSVGLATAFAMGLSGFFGVYLTEEAEREAILRDLERAMLQKLRGSVIKRAHTFAIFFAAIVDSLAPISATLISLFPIFLSLFKIIQVDYAIAIAILVTFGNLFLLGYGLGKISRKSVVKSGLKMLVVGIIAVVILSFIGKYA